MKVKHPAVLRIFLIVVILSFIVFLLYFGSMSILKSLYPMKYSDLVKEYSAKNSVSEQFIYAVIKCESDFKSDAVSNVGAKGLMQIMPDTFTWIKGKLNDTAKSEEVFDPETNIKYGCYLYGYLIEKFESEDVAVAAYHAGIGNVSKWLADEKYSSDGKTLKDIPFPTTKKYVTKVLETKKIYEKLY